MFLMTSRQRLLFTRIVREEYISYELEHYKIREAFDKIGRPAPERKGLIDSLPLLTLTFGRRAGNMKEFLSLRMSNNSLHVGATPASSTCSRPQKEDMPPEHVRKIIRMVAKRLQRSFLDRRKKREEEKVKLSQLLEEKTKKASARFFYEILIKLKRFNPIC